MRFDGRKDDELREIKIKIGVLRNVDGSAYFQIGKTKVIAGAFAPRILHPKHLQKQDRAIIRFQYDMLPFSVPERKKPGPTRRSIELSKIIREVLEGVVFVNEFPRSVIDVYVKVINADAGTRCAAINAACLALAQAGVPMIDLVAAVAVGKVGQRIVLDLCKKEEDYGELVPINEYYGEGKAADMPLAYCPLRKEFLLIQMDGEISSEDLEKMLALGKKGCLTIYEIMKKSLKEGRYPWEQE